MFFRSLLVLACRYMDLILGRSPKSAIVIVEASRLCCGPRSQGVHMQTGVWVQSRAGEEEEATKHGAWESTPEW